MMYTNVHAEITMTVANHVEEADWELLIGHNIRVYMCMLLMLVRIAACMQAHVVNAVAKKGGHLLRMGC